MHDPRLMHDPRFGPPPHDPFRGAADVLQFPSFFRERLNVNASALRRVVGAGSLAKLFHENIGLWRHECAVVEHARARVDAGLAADGRAGGDRPLLLSLAQDARRPASETDLRRRAGRGPRRRRATRPSSSRTATRARSATSSSGRGRSSPSSSSSSGAARERADDVDAAVAFVPQTNVVPFFDRPLA